MSYDNTEREFARIKKEWGSLKPPKFVEEFCIIQSKPIETFMDKLIQDNINSGRFDNIDDAANQLGNMAGAYTANMTSSFVMIGLDCGSKNPHIVINNDNISDLAKSAFPLSEIASKDLNTFVTKLIGGLATVKYISLDEGKVYATLFGKIALNCYVNCFRFGIELSRN
jgi:hypothetical protein